MRRPVFVVLVLAALASASACTADLPEGGTPAAELYRERCGGCHRLYAPSVTRFATWEIILPRMEQRMVAARQAPLTSAERQMILDYLRRNGG